MPLWPQFVGGSARTRSKAIGPEETINLFPETSTSAENAKQSTLYGTPGLKAFLEASGLICRGWFSEDDLVLAVVGANLYRVNVSGVAVTLIGLVVNDGLPVSFASNGRGGEQVAIVSGGQLVVLDLTTMILSGAIALPLTNAPVVVRFIDGYFLLLEKDSIRFWFSTLEDGTLWDALDFIARSGTSDNLVGLDVVRGRVWRFGSETTDVVYDAGDPDVPFVPYPGSLMQEGLVSPYAEAVQGEAIMWVSQDSEGLGRIVRTTDYAPERISTPAIDVALASYPTLTDCEALVYEQEGHPFIAWTFPSGGFTEGQDGVTWCWDNREQLWHQRASWDAARGIFTRWRARGCASTTQQNTILVGDYQTGDLYTLDLNTFDDNGDLQVAQRTCPYLSAENQWLFLDQFEVGIQSGVGLVSGQGVDPVIMLQLSRDSGNTWTAWTTARMGRMGEYDCRAIFRQLGRTRADRLVVRVRITDPVRRVLGPGAWVKATPGSGQL